MRFSDLDVYAIFDVTERFLVTVPQPAWAQSLAWLTQCDVLRDDAPDPSSWCESARRRRGETRREAHKHIISFYAQFQAGGLGFMPLETVQLVTC